MFGDTVAVHAYALPNRRHLAFLTLVTVHTHLGFL